jgi:GABA permease
MGAGLFVGIGTAIATTGRLILLSYAIAGGFLLVLVRMADRIRDECPDGLLLTDHLEAGLSARIANVGRRMYWCFWTILVCLEGIAGGNILVPEAGLRRVAVELALIVATVWIGGRIPKIAGRFGIPFALLKVVVLATFILLLAPHLLALRHAPLAVHPPLSLWEIPGNIAAGVALAMFSLAGIEVVHGVASGAARNQNVKPRTTTLTAIRIFGLYMMSMAILLSIITPSEVHAGFSPFTKALEFLGYEWTARCLDAVVLLSILAALHAAVVTAGYIFPPLPHDDPSERSSRRIPFGAMVPMRVRPILAALALTILAGIEPRASYAFLVKVESLLLIATYGLFVLGVHRSRVRAATPKCRGGTLEPMIAIWFVLSALIASAYVMGPPFIAFLGLLVAIFVGGAFGNRVTAVQRAAVD